ncbi:MAG: murein biosynthesis integral membrane protein MurJ, partial [Actinomycetota bacterium]|nr:murein biosynthesis integral membrane protein MurJ [Actinomycetota bacterium]
PPPRPAAASPHPRPAPAPASPAGMSEQRSLRQDTGVLAAGTLLSRLTGFLRVLVATYLLGINRLTDAYNFANAVPNTIYDLLLGGILAATMIPVFVDELRREEAGRGDGGISAVLGTVSVALVALSVALFLLAPWVVHFYLLLSTSSAKREELVVGTKLLRLFAPQVFFLGAIVVSTALLNARRRFGTAAFSPVINNLIAIAALVVTGAITRHLSLAAFEHDRTGLLVLGLGTTAGYVVQFVVQLPAMIRAGVWRRPRWAPRHPAVRRLLGLSSWLVGVVVANQVSYNLIAVIANRHSGDFTVYTLAYQFFQLPYSLFAVSIASAIMPDLAERWADRDHVAFLRRVILGVRTTYALLVPVAIGYAIVARPVIQLLAHHGAVHAAKAEVLGSTLAVFALGLPGFSMLLPLARALQAMKDTRAMFAIYALENGLTVVAAYPLFRLLGVPGLAIAWAAPYTVASLAAAGYLRRHVGHLGGVFTGRSLVRVTAATAVMALAVGVVGHGFPHTGGDPVLLARVAVETLVGTGVFLGLAWLLDIGEVQAVVGPLLRRLRPAAQGWGP